MKIQAKNDRNSARRPSRTGGPEQSPRQRFSRTRVRSFLFSDEASAAADGQGPTDSVRKTPELALMLAVLEDAIACFHGSLKAPRENPEVLHRQAHHWLRVTDWDSPFSFNNVCEALGLDPQATRERIAHARVPEQYDHRMSSAA
jgi:hypothetical protein